MSNGEWKGAGEEREFEGALRRSLRRVEAPQDFVARVMAKAGETGSRKQETGGSKQTAASGRPWLSFAPRWGWKPAWGALAAMLVAAVLTGHVVREHRAEEQQRIQASASREFNVSVQITDRALEHAREQLRRAGVPLEGEQ